MKNLRTVAAYVQRRLNERSTRLALVTIAGTLGMSIAAEHLEVIAAVMGLALVVLVPEGEPNG